MKRDEIYRKIRQDIISGILKEGDKLPTEFESAELFHVSRDTVRDALRLLEQEGYIERVKAKGTFVKLPKVDTEDRNISFLVSCYQYLRCSGIHNMNLLFELIAQAAIAGWRITPVIYSRTNDPNNIWWENLEHFNSNSRVIVNRSWFQPYFETLTSIGARVAYIDNDQVPSQGIAAHSKNWLKFIEQDRVAAKKALAFLKAQGCKKISLFMPNIMQSSNTIADEYRKFAAESEQEELIFPTPKAVETDSSVLDVSSRVASLAKQGKIDGLLIHTDEFSLSMKGSFRSSLGLPKDFPVVVIPCKTDQIYNNPNENIPIIHYPIEKMAQDIIYWLTAGQHIAQTRYYEPELKLCGTIIKTNIKMK